MERFAIMRNLLCIPFDVNPIEGPIGFLAGLCRYYSHKESHLKQEWIMQIATYLKPRKLTLIKYNFVLFVGVAQYR